MRRRNRYITQDRIAMRIAARYGMTYDYKTARRNGLNPLEALESLTMEKDENRKQFVDGTNEINKTNVVGNREIDSVEKKRIDNTKESKFTRALTIISAIALLLSAVTSFFAYQATMKVSSKEYEITQNMKYDLTELVATLKSIHNKALLLDLSNGVPDFTSESESLKSIQTRPGYLIFLNLIENRSEKHNVEEGMLILTDMYLVPNETKSFLEIETESTIIRAWTDWMLRTLDKYISLTGKIDKNYFELLEQSCSESSRLKKNDIDSLYIESRSKVFNYIVTQGDFSKLKHLDSVFHANHGDTTKNKQMEYDWAYVGQWQDWLETSKGNEPDIVETVEELKYAMNNEAISNDSCIVVENNGCGFYEDSTMIHSKVEKNNSYTREIDTRIIKRSWLLSLLIAIISAIISAFLHRFKKD